MEITGKLASWILSSLPSNVTVDTPLELSPIAGDAGFRRYFRLNCQPSLMAVYAPPDREDVPGFVSKDLAFKAGNVGVPTVYAVDYQRGFMLQEDLGDQLLLPMLTEESARTLYDLAERALARIQLIPPDSNTFPPYDADQLQREMALFPDWFIGKLLQVELDDDEKSMTREVFEYLAQMALCQPQVVVHRDYHSRNLLVTDRGELGVVDFQDALIGAFTYDLVSLLKDCYIRWPAEFVRSRALAFLQARLRQINHQAVDDGQLLQWFDLMGLQRHLKVLGIFARLWLRDGKSRYLDDLPLVFRYTLEVTSIYPDLKQFDEWLTQKILPRMSSQPWYRDWRTAGD